MTALQRRILIMAGGTGGHVFPALAVAERLRADGHQVLWIGTERGMESRVVPAAGFDLQTVEVSGVRGKGLAALLKMPWMLLKPLRQCAAIIRRFRPQVALGMGGFASFPGALMSRLLGVPLVIHEQNRIAGSANRLLSRIANRVLLGFPGAIAGGAWVGNPLRAEIETLEPKAEAESGLQLLVLGGSLGAEPINRLLPEALALLPADGRPQVRHQCGRQHAEVTAERYREVGVEASVEPFIEDMAAAYRWADVAVCRAGALTVSELAAAGLPSLLVPLPHAIDDHQTHNARFLTEAGGAWLTSQSELSAEALVERLSQWQQQPELLADAAVVLAGLARRDATDSVVQCCTQLAERNRA